MRFDRTSNLVGHFPTSLLATRLFSANTLNVRYIHKILKKEKDPGPIHAIPERHEATTLGKAKLPYDGRNISARVCKAAFRQKLGSIAVREFRPVICNCRAAHYNSPFLASELPPRTIPRALVLLPSRVRLVSATGATEDSAVGAFSLSLSLSLSFSASLPPHLSPLVRAHRQRTLPSHFAGKGARLIKTFIFNCDFNCFSFAPRSPLLPHLLSALRVIEIIFHRTALVRRDKPSGPSEHLRRQPKLEREIWRGLSD
jgi:hypothetical protein